MGVLGEIVPWLIIGTGHVLGFLMHTDSSVNVPFRLQVRTLGPTNLYPSSQNTEISPPTTLDPERVWSMWGLVTSGHCTSDHSHCGISGGLNWFPREMDDGEKETYIKRTGQKSGNLQSVDDPSKKTLSPEMHCILSGWPLFKT